MRGIRSRDITLTARPPRGPRHTKRHRLLSTQHSQGFGRPLRQPGGGMQSLSRHQRGEGVCAHPVPLKGLVLHPHPGPGTVDPGTTAGGTVRC